MLSTWHALLLGVTEGITEFLPISSTGHLILVSSLLGLDQPPETKSAVDAFSIVIQGGAILAVAAMYGAPLRSLVLGLVGRSNPGRRLLVRLLIAFMPAAVTGLLLEEAIENALFHPVPVLLAIALGGVALIALGPWLRARREAGHESRTTIESMSMREALIIGCWQVLALWPGTSRSMCTMLGGMATGLSARQSAEFSFLLGIPTLGGACIYKLAKNLTGDGPNLFEALGVAPVCAGFVAAMISAFLAIRWLIGWLNQHGMALFGWYRVGLALLLSSALLLDWVSI